MRDDWQRESHTSLHIYGNTGFEDCIKLDTIVKKMFTSLQIKPLIADKSFYIDEQSLRHVLQSVAPFYKWFKIKKLHKSIK